MQKHTILFLSANPKGTDLFSLTETARSLYEELKRGDQRDRFLFETRWAARPLDLLRELRTLRPSVVHFSGTWSPEPGRSSIEHRRADSPDPEDGVVFQTDDGVGRRVSAKALADTFAAVTPPVQLVVFGPCYSEVQAEALVAHVSAVVGLVGSSLDEAVRNFAIGLYGGLGDGESIAAAYQQGCAAIGLGCHIGGDRPRIRVRAGVDASHIVLGGNSPGAQPAAAPPSSVDAAQLDSIREVMSRAEIRATAASDSSAQLDAYTEFAVASSYLEAVGPTIGRIAPARVGGDGKIRNVDLDKLYISLIADPTTFEEHERARELEATMFIARSGEGRWTDLLGRPLPSGVIRRIQNDELPGDRKRSPGTRTAPSDASNVDESLDHAAADAEGESLHRVVRQKRHCLILGDPGSGKSVLCRWLFRESAKCWLGKRTSVELGPSRVPFLILLRDFAQQVVAGNAGSVMDYLCAASTARSTCSAGDWRGFVHQIMNRGEAFLILDGLDEVPRERMLEIRKMIESFTRQWVTATADPARPPDSGTGNQIVITSRCTGYYQTALPSDLFAHFVIRPMTARQIDQFCRHWSRAIGRAALAEPLLAEIFDPKRPNIRSMASNPLLLSILCQLGSDQTKKVVQLPQIRAELYEKVVRETAESWRQAAHASLSAAEPYFARLLVGVDNVLALFSPVAGHMHANLISNEIDKNELQEWLVRALAWFDGRADHDLEPHEWHEHQKFLMDALERVVGVLSERSPGRYSFLHLTFQEYLAGISLLLVAAEDRVSGAPVFDASAQSLVDRILANEYLLEPRWRQPLLLLCGQLAWMEHCAAQGQPRIAPRLADVIGLLDAAHRDGRTRLRDDWWAIILADILAEVPDQMLREDGPHHGVLVRTVAQLLDAYHQFGPGAERERGRQIFAEKLAIIRRRVGSDPFEQVLLDVCGEDLTSARSCAAAHLLLSRAWLSQRAVDFFSDHLDQDDARWQWSIHRLLRQAATVEPLVNVHEPRRSLKTPPPEAARELRHYRAALSEWQRLALESTERVALTAPLRAAATAVITEAVTTTPLARALDHPQDGLLAAAILGGFGDHDTLHRQKRYRELARWAESTDGERDAALDAEPWRYVPWFGAEEPDREVAVHLDTASKRLYWVTDPVHMDAGKIVRHRGLASAAAEAIAAGTPIAAMLGSRANQLPADWDLAELIAVARLTGLESLLAATRPPSRREVQRITWHIDRIQDDLVDACHRGAQCLRGWLDTECAALSAADRYLIHRTICSAWVASGLSSSADGPRGAGPTPWAYSVLAQPWGRCLLGLEQDHEYNLAVMLDTGWPARTAQDAQALLRAIVGSPTMRSSGVKLPDLLELGTGRTPLPPIAFYEAVVQLAGCVAERLYQDLSEGWLSVALANLRGHDPVADICAGLYLRERWTGPARSSADLPPVMVVWRQSLSIHFLSSIVPGVVVEDRADGKRSLWLQAWNACSLPDHRAVLARDAASLGLIGEAEIATRVGGLLATLDAESCIEGALLAGYIARQTVPESGRAWLRLAIDCLIRANDDDWRAEVILAIEPLLDTLADATDRGRLAELQAGFSPRHQAVAAGCPSRWVRSWAMEHWPSDDQIRGALAATLVVAAALDARARDAGGSRSAATAAAQWKDLTQAFTSSGDAMQLRYAVDELVDAAGAGSLVLTEHAIQALEIAASKQELSVQAGVLRLLPMLERPTASTFPRLRQLQHQLRASPSSRSSAFASGLDHHVILWLAEAERRFSADDIAPLSSLVAVGEDRTRARVRLLLHGPEVWLGHRPARFSLAALASSGGQATLERLGHHAVQQRSLERHEAVLGRSLYEWRMDDTTILREWLGRLATSPSDMALLQTVFRPWRWSGECLALWSEWIPSIQHADCLKACAEWLAVLHVAAEDRGPREVMLPDMTLWQCRPIPDLSWLPRKTADRLVIAAFAEAAKAVRGTVAIVAHVRSLLAAKVCRLRDLEGQDADAVKRILLSFGDALTHTIGETPETAWLAIKQLKPQWSADEVAAFMAWTYESLATWNSNRAEASLVLFTTCISQLSILACLADLWPNSVRHAALQEPAWLNLLCDVARYFHSDRAVQAVWVLAARIAGPGTHADDLWAALRCAVKDQPIVHERVLTVLASEEGKSLMAALSPMTVRAALEEWTNEPSGQSVLTMARMFGILAQEPALDGRLRQEIQARLRTLATHPGSHRFLFRLVGMGLKQNAFKIAGGRLLDEALQTLDSELFTYMTSSI